MFGRKSKEKELKMVWEVTKANKKSFLVGTAHFFPYKFKTSLSRLIASAQVLLLEGPLDNKSMEKVVTAGFSDEKDAHPFPEMDQEKIDKLSQKLLPSYNRRNPFHYFRIGSSRADSLLYTMIKGMKSWLAFFTIWNTYLERRGWRYSVDLEAYHIALEMKKPIIFLESIDEQIQVLESLSHDRIIEFLKQVDNWDDHLRQYSQSYLDGDLDKLKSIGLGFPSRHFSVINWRDNILFKRMSDYLKKGNALACVGAPHIRGLSQILRKEGYEVEQRYHN